MRTAVFTAVVTLSASSVFAQMGLSGGYGAAAVDDALRGRSLRLNAQVYVIAPSVSTASEARRILAAKRWTAVDSARDADAVLVVVRSGLQFPLSDAHYRSLSDLNDDATRQLNVSGERVHAYVFQFDQQLRLIRVAHHHWPADD